CHLERVDVIDAFAGIGPFAEQVLVDVRDGGGIRVDAVHAGKHELEQGTFAANRQRGGYPWLQHRVTLHDPARGGVETRPIERVRHLADQTADGVARQPCIGVECDDVTNVSWNVWTGGHRAGTRSRWLAEVHETGICRTAQQAIQFMQLAALALPAAPPRLPAAPRPL